MMTTSSSALLRDSTPAEAAVSPAKSVAYTFSCAARSNASTCSSDALARWPAPALKAISIACL